MKTVTTADKQMSMALAIVEMVKTPHWSLSYAHDEGCSLLLPPVPLEMDEQGRQTISDACRSQLAVSAVLGFRQHVAAMISHSYPIADNMDEIIQMMHDIIDGEWALFQKNGASQIVKVLETDDKT